MPSYKGQLSDDDIASIIEYQKTISQYAEADGGTVELQDAAVPDEAGDQTK